MKLPLPWVAFFLVASSYVSTGESPQAKPFHPPARAIRSATNPRSSHPDVFLITIDTLRADHVGCYGDAKVETPTLDQLAADGIRFENAFTPSPITNTSHTSIMTGLYPSSHGVTDFGVPLRSDITTLAQVMHGNGYATAAFIGAVILDSKTLAPGLDRGFQFYDNFPPNLPRTTSRYVRLERRGMEVVNHAERWLRSHHPAKAPRFVWVHLYDPHDPYEPPAPYVQKYHDRLYDGEIAYADHALGNLVRSLKQSHRYDNALIVVVGDHGEGLGEHGEDTHGIFLYDSTTHVPLILKLPNQATAGALGKVLKEQVQTIDILPTIASILALKLPAPVDGVSLHSLWADKAQETSRSLFAETDYPLRFGWSSLKSVRVPGKKYVEAPRPELYDLSSDPGELHNLYEPWDDRVKQLREQMAAFRARKNQSSANNAGGVPSQTIDELKALGYLGTDPGSTTAAEPSLLPDPKDKIQIQNLLHTAMLAGEDRNLSLAKGSLERAVAQDATSATALTQLGQLELANRNYQRAADLLGKSRALRADPTTALDEGRARIALGDFTGAEKALQSCLQASSGQYEPRYLLGKAYAGMSNWQKAQDQLEAAIFLDANRPEAQLELGRVLLAERLAGDALPHLEKAAKQLPRSAEVFELLEKAHSALGEKEKASQASAKAKLLATPQSK